MRTLEVFLETTFKGVRGGMEGRGRFEYIKSILLHFVKEFNTVVTLLCQISLLI